MRKLNQLWVAVALLLCCQARAELGSESSAKFWEDVLGRKSVQINYLTSYADFSLSAADRRISNFVAYREQERLKFHELKFLLPLAERNPYEYQLVAKEMVSNARNFATYTGDLNTLKRDLEITDKVLQEMRGQIVSLSGEKFDAGTTAALASILADLDKIRARLFATQEKIDANAEPTKELLQEMQAKATAIRADGHRKMLEFLSRPLGNAFDSSYWTKLRYQLLEWRRDLPLTLFMKFPHQPEKWLSLALTLLAALAIGALGHLAAARRRKLPPPMVRCWYYAVLAVALAATGLFLAYPETALCFQLAAVLLARLTLELSWELRHPGVPARRSPLAPAFWLFAAATASQALNLNFSMMTLFWPPLLLLAVAWGARTASTTSVPWDKAWAWITTLVSCCLLALALLGYVFLAGYLTTLWFLLTAGLRFCDALSGALRRGLLHFREGKSELLKAIVIGLGIPLLWLGIFSSELLWFSDQVGAGALFTQLFSLDFPLFNNVRLSFANAAMLVFFFFAFRTMLDVLKSSITRLYGAGSVAERSLVPSLKTLLAYVVWSLYAILALRLLGVSFNNLAMVGGGLGIGLGIGLKDVLNNFVCGIIILTGRTFHHGDIIQVGDIQGKVTGINIRSTVVQTFENAILVIPNSTVISNQLINWTRNDPHVRRDIKLGVAYGTDIPKMKEVLLDIARQHGRVLKSPLPQVLFMDFGDSALLFSLRLWIDDVEDASRILSELRDAINSRFNEAGIVIAYPHLDVSMVRG